jgi:dTDP-4-dehydrorhamnose 3,5-epimerase-like enzyme
MIPEITKGNAHTDTRGTLFYNNEFDVSAVKRMYVLENESTRCIRAWQGHKIEQRWFSVIKGSFRIQLIEIDNWDTPSKDLGRFTFIVNAQKLDVLYVPSGYVTSIQSLEQDSKLLVMTDYRLNEIIDEFRFPFDYFVERLVCL